LTSSPARIIQLAGVVAESTTMSTEPVAAAFAAMPAISSAPPVRCMTA
jgi:hypothetical protein